MKSTARILVVAGSDSGGGAGIQADIKTVTMLGGYAATAITALTAQNTLGVADIYPVPQQFVARQMRVVLEDIGADAIKTGMLHSAEIITAVAEVLADYPAIPLIVDPVMVASSGSALLQPQAITALQDLLFPRASLITPNIPEAELLTGMAIRNLEDMRKAVKKLQPVTSNQQPAAILLKGGHLEGDIVSDMLFAADMDEIEIFESKRINSRNTHGTGCTLASAIATGLAQGMNLHDAVSRAREYVRQAITHAPDLGKGCGPLGHGRTLENT